ncbi:prepilin peptidase [Defluviimonas sp. WL0050]|uniref:Prepilin peptidase n=1 Tax=Albidovulum litorale TaxID=2984134 RepID=A0ABT2ZKP6_9RHOB|nr:prepilin peptidase [Defluviimonas sp. WL0050]MCV2871704.1 prepilin peptidase [Defluviimonas sp. WL0050]
MLNPYAGPEAVAFAYRIFLVLCVPVCAWVAWSDLKYMKIPNKAVYALVGIFAVAGILLVPFDIWLWRWLSLVVVLVIGIVLNAVAGVGAGDAKFAAAAAPFFVQSVNDARQAAILLAAFLLGAFASHRLLRAIPAVRAMTPDWVSWTHAKFPMGLALVGTFLTYLTLLAFSTFFQGPTG